MTLILRSAILNDIGLVRTNNEDSALAGDRLVAVADGMGGLPAGEVASEIVIRILDELTPADRPRRGRRGAAGRGEHRQPSASTPPSPSTRPATAWVRR